MLNDATFERRQECLRDFYSLKTTKIQGSVDRAGDANSVNIIGNFRYDTLKRELQQRSLQHEFAGMLKCSLEFTL